jgi:hypothetical protein
MRKLIVALCAFLPGLAAANISISWVAPTQRVDGSPLAASEIASYQFDVTLNGSALPSFTVPGTATTYTYVDSVKGRYCFKARTVDTAGLQSDPSAEVCRNANPRPPGQLSAK